MERIQDRTDRSSSSDSRTARTETAPLAPAEIAVAGTAPANMAPAPLAGAALLAELGLWAPRRACSRAIGPPAQDRPRGARQPQGRPSRVGEVQRGEPRPPTNSSPPVPLASSLPRQESMS